LVGRDDRLAGLERPPHPLRRWTDSADELDHDVEVGSENLVDGFGPLNRRWHPIGPLARDVTVEDMGQADTANVAARQNARHGMADGAETEQADACNLVRVGLVGCHTPILPFTRARGATPAPGHLRYHVSHAEPVACLLGRLFIALVA